MSSNYFVDLDSNMPVSEDNIDIMEDISIELLQPMRDFESYIAENDLASAAIVLNAHPDLKKCLFNAQKYNKLRDALIATQRTYLGDVKTYITEAMTNKGIYDSNITYYKFNIVSYLDDYYMAIINSTNGFSNVEPSNTSYWLKMTIRGNQGMPGTGLIPSGEWTNSNTYYYYSDSNNYIHASMVYYNNCLYQCVTNGISGDSNSPTNAPENWEMIMSLQVSVQDITTDYGALSEVLLKTDNLIDILVLSNSYTYTSYEEFGIINEKIIENNNTLILKESWKENDQWNIRYYLRKNNNLLPYRYFKLYKENNQWITENIY